MPQIVLNISENMLNRIDSFEEHFNCHSRHEAVRMLFLKAFEAYGNPLTDEPVRFKRGAKPKEKVNTDIVGNSDYEPPTAEKLGRPLQPSDFYSKEYKIRLGLIDAENVTETS